MKTQADLIKNWLRKAESDLAAAQLCLSANQSLDTVCFHAQQAAEKNIKAYLTASDITFPYIHNLEKLIDLCIQKDSTFSTVQFMAQSLTPYAVELRYEGDFWPDHAIATEAINFSVGIRDFILRKLPEDKK